ncbi:MAG: signal peptide peptidase SppA [Mariprofundus sp.]|nr:signal peptide peptidase SppA [Mariprofundus sp.]
MKQFFSTLFLWLGRIRNVLINGIFIIFLLLFVSAMYSGQPKVPDSAALVIDPHGQIVEELELPTPGSLPFDFSFTTPNQTNLHELVEVIEHAAVDDRIRLLVLKLNDMEKTSLPKLQELRQAITVFKSSGKMVIAVGPNYSQSQYYLAAMADQVFLDPMGVVALQGFSIYRNYFKAALDKLSVDVQIFRAGKYKAAIEPLIRNDMSEEDRSANQALLSVLWGSYKDDVADMRGIKAGRLQALLDKPASFLAKYDGDYSALFKAEGLIDALADYHTIENYIAGAMGVTSGSSSDYASIDFHQYRAATLSDLPAAKNRQVGVITASGMIVDGEQPPGMVGSESMIEMLERARLNPQISAVVLRIDSPGGSAQASEAIRSAIVHLKASGKPVVVSMGSLAASGGYWMAAPADEIWAYPTTITGSIGAFGVMANVEQGLKKLGIHTDGLGTTSIAGGIRADRSMPEQLNEVMSLAMQHTYRRFLGVVSDGRGLSVDEVAKLAEGRVWTGVDAQRLGLVDALGGLKEAITAAAKRANIEADYSPVWIRPPLSMREMVLLKLFGSADTFASSLLSQSASVFGLSLPASLKLDINQYARILSLSSGQPHIFTLCDVRVSP